MQDKMMIRKKAMDQMMREKPELPIKKKPEPMMGQEQEGFESFMVTPEEKEMILEMRKAKGGGAQEEDGEEGI